MAYGGADLGHTTERVRSSAVSSGNTSSPSTNKPLTPYIVGMVLFEAFLLGYGRRVFRNYHGG